jgi:hypothetical protein
MTNNCPENIKFGINWYQVCLNSSTNDDCPPGLENVGRACLKPCSLTNWDQNACSDNEICSENYCRPLNCSSDADCNGFICNLTFNICSYYLKGLHILPLYSDGIHGTSVAGSPVQWNDQSALTYSTIVYISPRTNFSILFGMSDEVL